MPWTLKNISDAIDESWKEAGVQMYSLDGGDDKISQSLALLALDPEKCALLQITFPLDEDGVMDAFIELRAELKLDNMPVFTTSEATEEDTHGLVKLARTHADEIPDSILKEFMLRD